jgi:hypothetical protein
LKNGSIDPLSLLAVGPESLLLDIFLVFISTPTILFAILPVASVGPAVWPRELPIPFFLVHNVFTLILPSVRPDKDTLPVHFVIPPNPLILSLICPLIISKTLDVVVFELSIVLAAITPNKLAVAVFKSINKVPLIASSIDPPLYSIAMLFVIEPLTSI